MKHSFIALLLTLISIPSMGQKITVNGVVIDKTTKEAIISATVQVLSLPDSTMVDGAATNADGSFTIKGVKKGKYALKVTYIGYKDHILPLDLSKAKSPFNAGYITLAENSRLLKEQIVSAAAAQVQVSGDSLVYNASAYRTAEGSMLEDLVKKLPGATMDDDGTIKINGKTVNKILVDGKEFFLNDKEMALKNIPTNIIDKIKTYDRKSDLSRVTGIDDGEEETVLDLSLKRGMNNGWFGNADLAGGTQHRYSGRVNMNRFLEGQQYSLITNANNTGNMGFGGGGGRGGWGGRGGGGLRSYKDVGFNFATGNDIIEVGGNVRYRYNGSDTQTERNSQNFRSENTNYSTSLSNSWNSNYGLNADFRMEWKPDSMTNIIFRPSGSISRNRSKSKSVTGTFNDNPYDNEYGLFADPIGMISDHALGVLDSIFINSEINSSQSYSLNKNLNGELQINRKLNNRGRNITFRATGQLSSSESLNLSASSAEYKLTPEKNKNNNRYSTTPGVNNRYSLQATYSEPIADRTYLQFSYRFNYSYNKNDRKTGIFDSYDPTVYYAIRDVLDRNRYNVAGAIDELLSRGIEPDYENPEAKKLAQYSEYRNFDHTVSLSFRKVTDKFNFSAGVDFLPQHSTMDYKYMNVDTVVTRTVYNFAPSVDFRYNFDKQTQLRINYRSRSSQPSMTNLLDIEDDSRPNDISFGNPGLKPSLNHNFNLNFNTFDMATFRGMFVWAGGGFTQNAISNVSTYFEQTGQNVTMPKNINGNWNTNLGFGFNQSFGKEKLFSINSMTNGNFNHQKTEVYNVKTGGYTSKADLFKGDIQETNTNNLTIMERLSFGYRKDWFDASISGSITYQHTANSRIAPQNPNVFNFTYGAEFNFFFPWGTSLSTDISESSRRGYSSKYLNTNELLWNMQVSQSFLKGKALTVSLQWNDILHQQSNISRMVDAMSQSDTRTNAIFSYGMIHVIYKLNIFGGKNVNGTDQERSLNPWGGIERGQGGPGGRPAGAPAGRPGGAGRPAGGMRPMR